VIGLGHVGERVARRLASDGAQLVLSDIDPTKRQLAQELGARWLDPEGALIAEADVLVPAALGGVLTEAVVGNLRCAAIAGPANNQLADDSVADLLHRNNSPTTATPSYAAQIAFIVSTNGPRCWRVNV
jgi:glutamate dehydrogenase/leucine dehydrogenase